MAKHIGAVVLEGNFPDLLMIATDLHLAVRTLLTKEFRMLDLPTLGRPMMATARALSEESISSADLGGGSIPTSCSIRSPVPVPLMADTAIGSRPSCQKSAICKAQKASTLLRCQAHAHRQGLALPHAFCLAAR